MFVFVGRAIRGRLVRDGEPVSGAVVGVVQVSRDSETFVGERTAETDASGRFLLLNLPADEPLVAYAKVDTLAGRGAMAAREVGDEPDGDVSDLGDLALQDGVTLSGRVVLADGKPVPAHARILVGRERALDTSEQELASDGSFRFPSLPREGVELSIVLRGFALSSKIQGLLPEGWSVRGRTLAGRLEHDTQLNVVLEPVAMRPPRLPRP